MRGAPLWRDWRGVSKVVGVVLLVAVVILLATVVAVGVTAYSAQLNTLDAGAAFSLSQHPAGIQMNVESIDTEITVRVNGDTLHRLDAGDAGTSLVVPVAPGDRIVGMSGDDTQNVLIDETILDCSRLGDVIAYYDFEKGSDPARVTDKSCNDNHGTLENESGSGGPQWADGSLRFDGTDDYVNVTGITTDNADNVSEFTIAVTYTQTGSSNRVNQLVEHQFSDGSREWFLETSDSVPEPYDVGQYSMDYAVQYNSEVAVSTAVSPGESHVVVGTYDGNDYQLYVDGENRGGGSHSQSTEMGTLRIGRDWEDKDQYFDGEISELRLYYHEFNREEVELLTDIMD
jgi:hypothetical protein